MKKTIRDLFLLSLLAGLASCASDDLLNDPSDVVVGNTDSEIRHITVTLPTIEVEEGVASTRNQFINMGTANWNAVWAEGDTLGIFPSSGGQVEFAVTSFGSNTSVFDGGGWALKSAVTYAAYYPFDKHNVYVTNKTIPLDYTGQVQQGNGSYDHLGRYDFLASKAMPRSGSSLNFELLRQGYVICLNLTVPATDTYTEIDLLTDGTPFVTKAELDISSTEAPVVTPTEYSKTIRLSLEDVTVSANGTLTAYMMAFPIGSVTPTVVLHGQNGTYSGVVQKVMNLTRNKMAIRPVTLTEYDGPAYIKFEDPEVKRICVENWDTNGDGELDMAEAAAVTHLNQVFAYNEDIWSFNELQYFTGLEVIDYDAFRGCSNLSSIQIPDGVTTIGTGAFFECTWLNEIDLPESVTTIADKAFAYCTNLYHVTMPAVTNIDLEAFRNTNLYDMTLSPVLQEIGNYAFADVSNMYSITLPATLTSIGEGAFYNSSLSGVYLEYDEYGYEKEYHLTTIPDEVFENCVKLEYLNIPPSVTTIGDLTFFYCTALHNIDLPLGLQTIGAGAFEHTSLMIIDVPETVIDLGNYAFNVKFESLQYIIWHNPVRLTEVEFFPYYHECPIYVPEAMVEQTKMWYPDNEDGNGYAHRIKSIESMSGSGEGSTTATMPDLTFSW